LREEKKVSDDPVSPFAGMSRRRTRSLTMERGIAVRKIRIGGEFFNLRAGKKTGKEGFWCLLAGARGLRPLAEFFLPQRTTQGWCLMLFRDLRNRCGCVSARAWGEWGEGALRKDFEVGGYTKYPNSGGGKNECFLLLQWG